MLEDVSLPLDAHILEGVSLAVPGRRGGAGHTLASWCGTQCPCAESAHPSLGRPPQGLSPVVKEELLTGLDGPLGEDADAVVSVHHDHCPGKRPGGLVSMGTGRAPLQGPGTGKTAEAAAVLLGTRVVFL